MNSTKPILLIVGTLLSGCLNFKPVVEQTKFFVLNPVPTGAPSTARTGEYWAIGLRPVEIPEYLESKQMVQRRGDHEIQYLSEIRWAERVNKGIRRVLVANLDAQLGSTNATLTAWRRAEVQAVVSVSIQRFESDESGHTLLEARWRLTDPAGETVLRDGFAAISRPASPPQTDPASTVTALSESLGELAKDIARDLRSALPTRPSETR